MSDERPPTFAEIYDDLQAKASAAGTRAGDCQTDIQHVYGPENPMVAWLAAKHPAVLKERARTALEETPDFDLDEEDEDAWD